MNNDDLAKLRDACIAIKAAAAATREGHHALSEALSDVAYQARVIENLTDKPDSDARKQANAGCHLVNSIEVTRIILAAERFADKAWQENF